MNKAFVILCLALFPAAAGATNFDACVNDAKQNNAVTTGDSFIAYKCESVTAEKLAARPDECPVGNVKPPLRGLVRRQRQLDDGLLTNLSWTAGKCLGSCVTHSYDSRDTTYECEVRIYGDDRTPETRLPETRLPGTRLPDAREDPTPGRQAGNEARRWRWRRHSPWYSERYRRDRWADRRGPSPRYDRDRPDDDGRRDDPGRPPFYARRHHPHRPLPAYVERWDNPGPPPAYPDRYAGWRGGYMEPPPFPGPVYDGGPPPPVFREPPPACPPFRCWSDAHPIPPASVPDCPCYPPPQ